MLFDAQYTLLESMDKVDWGHSTANLGLDIAMNHGVKRVVFTHHDPAAPDRKVRDAERQTREYHRLQVEALRAGGKKVPDMKWFFAREGMILDI
jgi:ribonuclease BN (tRNA processing enzyme)